MSRRHVLLVVLVGTLVIWCSPIVAFAHERQIVAPPVQGGPPHVPPPPVAAQPLPTFGALDAGGMPLCLHEVRAGGYSEGHLVLANTPYWVWVAPKKVGQEYPQASWRSFGPWTFTGGRRYLFRGGDVTSNPRPTSTEISPGLASLHFENLSLEPVWYVVNPLPPGCGGPGVAPGTPANPPPIDTRTQRTLAVRTELRPVGWKSDVLWFGPGTYWVDAFDGGVQSGPLAQTADLRIWNSKSTVGFGPGFMRFERDGGVKEGTLQANTSLCVVNTASNNKLSLTFMGNTTVEFGYDGCVMKGTLAQEATLKSWDGGSKTYPPGTLVDFNGAGLVTRAVLPPAGATKLDGLYNGTCTIVNLATFPFGIRASSGVFSGSQDQGLYSLQWQGNYDQNGNIQNGLMTGWVDVVGGGQKVRWTVRGPITGTLAAAALSITTADGKRTWTGSCGASGPGGTPPVVPGGGPAAGAGWTLKSTWTYSYSTMTPGRYGNVSFTGTTAIVSSQTAKTSHTWSEPPPVLSPGQDVSLQLGISKQSGTFGRAYTLVFYGSYSTKESGWPTGVMIPTMMDWAGAEADTSPLFQGKPTTFEVDRAGGRVIIDATLMGRLFLAGNAGAEASAPWSGKVPAGTPNGRFLLIVSSGHARRDDQPEQIVTVAAAGATYYEYVWTVK